MSKAHNIQPEDVIRFWFDDIENAMWWKKDQEFDRLISKRFGLVHTQASQGELCEWRLSALGALAEVIVLDQFSRNMYRDTPQAFAYDGQALVLAQCAIQSGMDKALSNTQKSFLYMPFMHSESRFIHEQAVQLYTDLGVEANLKFELKHKEIIDRFGRYPHRNALLGRPSTEEEEAFLKQPGSSF